MKVSIIITCYNSSKTIYKTIESCINQTYKNIEIIIIDDYSTDNSLDIINSFADNRIKVIKHNINKGAGVARQTGINAIRGDYMTFLDSDDYIKKDCIQILVYNALKHNSDIINPGYIIVNDKFDIIEERIPNKKIQKDKDKFKHDKSDTKRFMNPMLINSNLWKKVKYCERRFIEDTPTLFKILYYANKVVTIDYAGYYYVQNSNSLIHSANKVKYTIYRLLCAIDIYEFTKDKDFPDTKKHLYNLLNELFKLNPDIEELKKYKSDFIDIIKYFYKDNSEQIIYNIFKE